MLLRLSLGRAQVGGSRKGSTGATSWWKSLECATRLLFVHEWVCSGCRKESKLLLLITFHPRSQWQSRHTLTIHAVIPDLPFSTAELVGLENKSHRERPTEAPPLQSLCSASNDRQSPARLGITSDKPLHGVGIRRAPPGRHDMGGQDSRTNPLTGIVVGRRGVDAGSGPPACKLYVCNAALLVASVRSRWREGSAEMPKQRTPHSSFAIATLSLLFHTLHWQKGSDLVRDSPLK